MTGQSRIKVSIVVAALLLVFATSISSRVTTLAAPVQEPEKRVSLSPTPIPHPQEVPPPQRSLMQREALSHIGNGPFGPPDSNDTVFTQDSAPTMDEYRFRSQSPIEFPITIDRVVGKTNSEGYLLEPDKLIQNGIVSPKAHLQLLVWDVDEDYTGTDVMREIDKVYVNGHYIGNLSGANQTWSVTRLDLDIRYLKFAKPTCNENDVSHLEACHTPPTPVQNAIRIDIDTGNIGDDVWAVTVDWGVISFEAARPVLFVHGKGGSNNGGGYDYWDEYDGQYYFNFRGKFSSAGFLTAITENRLGGEVSIAENARRLKTIIGELKTRYGVRKVNLVGHSKGGLDSRGFISDSSLNSDNDVDILVTLASPHHGSSLADAAKNLPPLATLFGQSQTDALHNVTESYMNGVFNPSHPARQGVRYYAIAADAGQGSGLLYSLPVWQINSLPEESQRKGAYWGWNFLWTFGSYRGHNDFLVTVDSTKWDGISGHGNNSYHLGDYNLNHHSIRAGERQAGQEDNTIADLVKGVLDIKAGGSAGWLQAQPDYGIDSSATLSQTASSLGVLDGSINQGQTSNQLVGVDSSTFAGFTLLWQDGDLYLDLVTPNGTVITPSTTITTVTYAEDRTGGNLSAFMAGKTCVYNIITPLPGQWTVQITANASLPGGKARWVLLTTQDSPVVMSLATDQPWHRLNDQAMLAATLKNGTSPLLGANARATIVAPDGMTQTLSLYDNGTSGDAQPNDGVYSNRFIAAQSGTYRLSADATGTLGAGISFKRTAVAELPVGSGAAAFTTGYSDYGGDTNSDGLYDILRIDVPIVVTTTGQYGVVGTLYDNNNLEMGQADNTVTLTTGSNILPLDFDGGLIATRGGQGIFALRDLRLIDKSTSQPLQVDYLSSAYATHSYSNGQFQRAAVALTGNSNDFGSDTNGNGKYDLLTVNVQVSLLQAGAYTWNARLVDANDYEYGWSSSSGYMSAGNNMIPFGFSGQAISEHQVDGPYYLKDLALWSDSGYLSVINVAATSAYSYTQFEPAPKKVYLPWIARNYGGAPTDTYEPNDTMAQAYGPLTSGAVYTSYISSNADDDYYYFDISALGKVTVNLSNIGAPGADYDLELYNSAGLRVGGSWGVTTTEQIVFEPVATGRYYALVYFCCGTNTPYRPYYLSVQYNGAKTSGDIYGTVRAHGSAVSGVPIELEFYDYNTYDYRSVWSVTDGSGQYHFWGMNTLGPNQVYYPYYGYDLGSSYIGYWYGGDITVYTAGSSLFGGDMDISPLNLGTPNSGIGIPLPVMFTWTPRSTSPSETYRLRLWDPSSSSTYWYSSYLGHVGNFTLTALPTGFTTGRTYRWRVYLAGSNGGFGGSYSYNSVAFSSSTAATLNSAPAPWRPDKTDIPHDKGHAALR